VYFIFLYLYTE